MSQRIGISWRTAAALAAAVVLLPLLVFVDPPESAAHTKTVRRCIVDPPINHCWDEKVAHTHTPPREPDLRPPRTTQPPRTTVAPPREPDLRPPRTTQPPRTTVAPPREPDLRPPRTTQPPPTKQQPLPPTTTTKPLPTTTTTTTTTTKPPPPREPDLRPPRTTQPPPPPPRPPTKTTQPPPPPTECPPGTRGTPPTCIRYECVNDAHIIVPCQPADTSSDCPKILGSSSHLDREQHRHGDLGCHDSTPGHVHTDGTEDTSSEGPRYEGAGPALDKALKQAGSLIATGTTESLSAARSILERIGRDVKDDALWTVEQVRRLNQEIDKLYNKLPETARVFIEGTAKSVACGALVTIAAKTTIASAGAAAPAWLVWAASPAGTVILGGTCGGLIEVAQHIVSGDGSGSTAKETPSPTTAAPKPPTTEAPVRRQCHGGSFVGGICQPRGGGSSTPQPTSSTSTTVPPTTEGPPAPTTTVPRVSFDQVKRAVGTPQYPALLLRYICQLRNNCE